MKLYKYEWWLYVKFSIAEFSSYEEGDAAISTVDSSIGSTSTPNNSPSNYRDVICCPGTYLQLFVKTKSEGEMTGKSCHMSIKIPMENHCKSKSSASSPYKIC